MYARIENGTVAEYPIADIRARFPDMSLPATLTDDNLPEGFVLVHPALPPAVTQDQRAEPGAPVLGADGRWIVGWTVRALTPQESADRIQAIQVQYDRRIEARLDGFAQERQYKNIESLATYASSSNAKFAAEARRGIDLRDATYEVCNAMLAEVAAGAPVPSWEEVEARLPALTWGDEVSA